MRSADPVDFTDWDSLAAVLARPRTVTSLTRQVAGAERDKGTPVRRMGKKRGTDPTEPYISGQGGGAAPPSDHTADTDEDTVTPTSKKPRSRSRPSQGKAPKASAQERTIAPMEFDNGTANLD
jgi:hypothetical protein